MLMALGSYLNARLVGLPQEDVNELIALEGRWPSIVVLSLLTFGLFSVVDYLRTLRKRRATPQVFLYRVYRGKDGRKVVPRIVPQLDAPPLPEATWFGAEKERGDPSIGPFKVLNIPLIASLNRLYRLILDRGPKIAESLRQLKEDHKTFPLPSVGGKRVKSMTSSPHGRYVCSRFPTRKPWDVALAPTIRAAAPFQTQRARDKTLIAIQPQDIRVKLRERRAPHTILLLLDMSESMSTSLENIRNSITSMYDIAYKKRDRVALVIFKGSGASVLQQPTTNLNLLEKKLLQVGTSDFTPLASGMFQALRVLRNEKLRNKEMIPVLIIMSDGIANIPLGKPITPFTRHKFLNISQADVIDVAGLLQRDGIRTIVMNTAHDEESVEVMSKYTDAIAARSKKIWLDPTSLLLEVARITGGYYYGIGEGGELESAVLMDAFTVLDRDQVM
jgi:Mg-chelatase subunit ChlD